MPVLSCQNCKDCKDRQNHRFPLCPFLLGKYDIFGLFALHHTTLLHGAKKQTLARKTQRIFGYFSFFCIFAAS